MNLRHYSGIAVVTTNQKRSLNRQITGYQKKVQDEICIIFTIADVISAPMLQLVVDV